MASEHHCDVLIVGAGPAGLSAAITLAGCGHRVVVLADRPRRYPLAETLSATAEPLLRRLGVWDQFVAQQHAPWMRHVSAWGSSVLQYRDLAFEGAGPGWFIDRERFQHLLSSQASTVGCRVYDGKLLSSCANDGGCWTVQVGTQVACLSLRARMLIDAAGRVSRSRHRAFADRTCSDRLLATVFIFPGRETENYTQVETTPHGWCYSACANGAFIAAFFTDPEERFIAPTELENAPHTRRRLAQPLEAARDRVTLAATSTLRTCVASNNWIAVGDACMTLDPLSSSGILMALNTGQAAADLVVALDAGRLEAIDEYRDWTTKTYRRYLRERRAYYATEQRWSHERFWSRRAV